MECRRGNREGEGRRLRRRKEGKEKERGRGEGKEGWEGGKQEGEWGRREKG